MNNFRVSEEVTRRYNCLKGMVLSHSENQKTEECMHAAEELMEFMNRFRNCALKHYFDEDIHSAIASLNLTTYDTSALLKPKKKFRLAYVFNKFNDTGGASFPQRLMLEDPNGDDYEMEQYALVTGEQSETYRQKQRFQYMQNHIPFVEFGTVPNFGSMTEKANFIQNWLYERNIDFAVVQPDVTTIYAMASKPVSIDAWFSADWHTFTIGPGGGDNTLLMTTDQFFKYKFDKPEHYSYCTNIRLPLQSSEYALAQEPIDRSQLGIPPKSILSATTNLWKCSFGDDNTLFEAIASLVRKHDSYYHVFAGTPRGLDCLHAFMGRNPDLDGRIKYIGSVPNIYKLLLEIDFYINSYPVSGATNTEAALCGKPSIDFLGDRDLTGHGPELLRCFDCEVSNFEEFQDLGDEMIKSEKFRVQLGGRLREQMKNELDKDKVVKRKIHKMFLRQFNAKIARRSPVRPVELAKTLEYEKSIAVYHAIGESEWSVGQKKSFLIEVIEREPRRAFGWIKLLELACLEEKLFEGVDIFSDLPVEISLDYRVRFMLGCLYFREREIENSKIAYGEALRLAPADCRDELIDRINHYRSSKNSIAYKGIYYNY